MSVDIFGWTSAIFNYRWLGIRDARHALERLPASNARSLLRSRPMTAGGKHACAERPTPLYPRLLGPAWRDLHPAIRRLHLMDGAATGRFEFRQGRGLAARLIRWLLRLPSAATILDARLTIARDAESEIWMRMFGQRALVTTQRGLPDGSLAERFGALEFRFHLRVTQGAMTYVQAGAAMTVGRLRVPLPRWIAPRVDAREACVDGETPFVTVGISSPLIGVVMSYEGCIQVERP
jgi:Domain of unknown function (DUF4166)